MCSGKAKDNFGVPSPVVKAKDLVNWPRGSLRTSSLWINTVQIYFSLLCLFWKSCWWLAVFCWCYSGLVGRVLSTYSMHRQWTRHPTVWQHLGGHQLRQQLQQPVHHLLSQSAEQCVLETLVTVISVSFTAGVPENSRWPLVWKTGDVWDFDGCQGFY